MTTAAEAAVRETREALGLSIRELADLAGVDHTYLSRYERGERSPSRLWRHAVSEALGHRLAEINQENVA